MREAISRSFGWVSLVYALPTSDKLQCLCRVELNVSADTGRWISRRTIRGKNVVHEILLLIGHELVVVQIEERVLTDHHRKLLAR